MAHAKRVGSALVGLALTSALVACGGDNSDTGGGSAGDGKAVTGGTVTVYHVNDFEHLDPTRNFVSDSGIAGRLITRTLTDYRWDPQAKKSILEGDLAEKWESSPDAKTWTFHLKDGLKYEDGTPVKAADIKYAAERSFSPDLSEGSPYAKNYLDCPGYKGPYVAGNNGGKGCTAMEVPDDKTIIFKLNQPVAEFEGTATMKTWSPIPQAKDTKTQYDNRPLSTGPYKIDSYTRKKELVLIRNDQWDKKTDPFRTALPDKFVFKFGAEDTTVDQRLIADGAADKNSFAMDAVAAVNITKTSNANVKSRVVEGGDACRRYIGFNELKAPLKDPKLRAALYVGLDRTSYRDGRGGERLAEVIDSIIPQDMEGYKKEAFWNVPPTGDQAKAKELLKQSSYRGQTLVLGTSNTGLAVQAAEAAQNSWNAIGVKIEIKKIPGETYYTYQQQDASATDLITAGWCPDWPSITTVVPSVFGPDNTAKDKAAQNNYSRSSAGWDKLNALRNETDKNKLISGLSDVYGEIMKTAPLVPTTRDLNVYITGSNITNAYVDPNNGGIIDLTQIGLKKAN